MIKISLAIILIVSVAVIIALIVWILMFFLSRKTITRLQLEKVKLQKFIEAGEDKQKWLEISERKLKDAFEAVSAKVLRENSGQFMSQSKDQLKNVIEPLIKDLDRMDRQVQGIEKARAHAYGKLLNEVVNLKQAHQELKNSTTILSQALKSSSIRGRWGEIQLRRIAELAGMVEHIDFDEQKTTGSGFRPDMVIHLPNGGTIPLDAKAPMNAYLDACESQSPEEQKFLLTAHNKALSGHIKNLSKKGYWTEYDASPELVVMFLPYESGLEVSFSQDPAILDEALSNKVILVGPSTLYALLKVISYGWLQLKLTKNAQDIAYQGKELLERFKTFIGHFAKIGGNLNSATDSYNRAVGSMDSRILPSLRKLKAMGASAEEVPDIAEVANRAKTVDSH